MLNKMLFFKPGPIKLSQMLCPSRALHIFKKETTQVVIGSLTAVCAVKASFDQYPGHRDTDVRFVCTESWLSNVASYYLKKSWGQTKNGLPKVARDLFNDNYPNYPDDKLLTWGQIETLRLAGLEILEKQLKIPVYHGEPAIKLLENDGFQIEVQNDKHTTSFSVGESVHFYTWNKQPKALYIQKVLQRPVTDIFMYHPDVFPKDMDILIVGGRLSPVWVARELANGDSSRRIIHLKYPETQLITDIPANASVDYKRIITVNLAKVDLKLAIDDPNFGIVYSPEHNQTFQGPIFSSIGLETPTYNIHQSKLTSPSQWVERPWVSAKNIPIGSFLESFARCMALTDNLEWAYELQGYHETDFFTDVIKKHFSPELNMDIRYLHAWGNKVRSLDNPVPESKLKEFLTQIYRDVYSPDAPQVSLFQRDLNQWLNPERQLLEEEMPYEFTP